MTLSSKLASAAVVAIVSVMPAYATSFTGNYSTTVHNSGPGLQIQTNNLAPNLNFTLNNVGQSVSKNLFEIYTNESDVGADDLIPKPISVAFNFTSPAFGGVLEGTTFGQSFLGIFENGAVKWNNGGNAVFNFGNGGQLQVHLNDAIFNSGIFGLSDADCLGAVVTADFTLKAMTTAAPEPATWAFMIFGFGAAGYSLRRRRVSYGSAVAA